MHDPKAAVVLARLYTIRPPTPWKPQSEGDRDLRALLDERSTLSRIMALHHGHLEGMLARHWPEFGAVVDVHQQRSWMTLLLELPGPEKVVIDDGPHPLKKKVTAAAAAPPANQQSPPPRATPPRAASRTPQS